MRSLTFSDFPSAALYSSTLYSSAQHVLLESVSTQFSTKCPASSIGPLSNELNSSVSPRQILENKLVHRNLTNMEFRRCLYHPHMKECDECDEYEYHYDALWLTNFGNVFLCYGRHFAIKFFCDGIHNNNVNYMFAKYHSMYANSLAKRYYQPTKGNMKSYSCILAKQAISFGQKYCCFAQYTQLLVLPLLKYEFKVSFDRLNYSFNGVPLNEQNACPQSQIKLKAHSYDAIYLRCGDFLTMRGIPKLSWLKSFYGELLERSNQKIKDIVLIGNVHSHGDQFAKQTCPLLFMALQKYIETENNGSISIRVYGDHELFADIYCLLNSNRFIIFSLDSTFGKTLSYLHYGCEVFIPEFDDPMRLIQIHRNYHYINVTETDVMKPNKYTKYSSKKYAKIWSQ